MGGGGAIGGCGRGGKAGRDGGDWTAVPGAGDGVGSRLGPSSCKVPIGGFAGGAESPELEPADVELPGRDALAGAELGSG